MATVQPGVWIHVGESRSGWQTYRCSKCGAKTECSRFLVPVPHFHCGRPARAALSTRSRQGKLAAIMAKADEYDLPVLLSEAMRPHGVPASPHVSTMVLTAVRWVAAMDLFQETRDRGYDAVARDERRRLDVFLTAEQRLAFRHVEKRVVAPYWSYERALRKKVASGHRFSDEEVRESMVRRSEDSVLYGFLAGCVYDLPPGLVDVLHARQAFEDVLDCAEDFEEDVAAGEPNVFSMYLLSLGRPAHSWPGTAADLRSEVRRLRIGDRVYRFSAVLYSRVKKTHTISRYKRLERALDREFARLCRFLGR